MFSERKAIWLAILALSMGGLMVLSNILAAKIWAVAIFTFDGGLILFPLTYICRDLTNEFYGKLIADCLTVACCILNVVGFVAFMGADIFLDSVPGTGMDEIKFCQVLGLSARVMIASTLGYLCSGLMNNYLFAQIREGQHGQGTFRARALRSSWPARLADTFVFNTVAFFGRLDYGGLAWQMICAFGAGTLVEVILHFSITDPLKNLIGGNPPPEKTKR